MSNVNMFTSQITSRDLKDWFKFAERHKKSVFVYSHPGASKSAQIYQFADEMLNRHIAQAADEDTKEYLESLRGNNVVDLRLSQELPENLRGVCLPVQVDGGYNTVYATPSFWPQDPRWVGVIALDELTSAIPTLQAAAYSILLDRKVGDIVFPEGAVVVAAGNREGEGIVYKPVPAICNRVLQLEMKVVPEHWVEDFALQNRIHPIICAFIQQQGGQYLYNGDQDAECPAFASPRSWEFANNVLLDYEAGFFSKEQAFLGIAGYVGEAAGTAFKVFYELGYKLPNVKEVLEGKNPEFKLKGNISAVYILGITCLYKLYEDILSEKTEDSVVMNKLENMVMYFENNFKQERDLITNFIMQLYKYAKANESKCSSRLHLEMLRNPATKEALKEYNNLMQRAKA